MENEDGVESEAEMNGVETELKCEYEGYWRLERYSVFIYQTDLYFNSSNGTNFTVKIIQNNDIMQFTEYNSSIYTVLRTARILCQNL